MLRVLFSGTLRRVTGCAETEVPLPASRSLADLLVELAKAYPGVCGESAELQWRHGSSQVVVAVNGRLVLDGDAGGQGSLLEDGDEVTIMAPLGGG